MRGWSQPRWSLAFLLALLLVVLVVPVAHAIEPTDSFYVNDYVGVLNSRDVDYLVQRGVNLRAQNGVQIVVVIVDNYIGDSFDKYANQVYNDFGVGSKETNAGALLIVAMDDGEVKIEVGDGLSGQIPDSKAGQILDRYFVPAAREGNISAAVYQTYLQLIQEGSRLDTPGDDPGGTGDTGSLIVGIIGILLMVGALIGIIVLIRRAARRQPPSPPYGGPSQGYPYGRSTGMPSQPPQGPLTRPNTGGPFSPYGGTPDYRLPRRVFFPFGGGTTTYPAGQGSSGNQDNQPDQQRPKSSGGGGKSAGGGASRPFPSSRSGGSSGRSSTPRSTPRSPFSGSSRPGGLFGGGGRSIGGGGRSSGGGASRGFKR